MGGMMGQGGGMMGQGGGMMGQGGGMMGQGGGMMGQGGGMMGQGGGMPNMGGMGGMTGIFINQNVMNMPMQGMNIGGNWTSIYNNTQQNNNININNSFGPQKGGKINVIFKTTMGLITNVLIDHGKTMSELIQVYLKRVDKFELYNTQNTILFLFNAKKLSMTDNTKVEQFFSITPNPTIVVNDARGLIGA